MIPLMEEIYDQPDDGNGMELLALLVRDSYAGYETKFFTASEAPLQVGCIHHHHGHVVPAHTHRPRRREVMHTQEVLIVRSGIIKVTLYDFKGIEVTHRVLYRGDLILLAGPHKIEFLQEGWLFEVKQGPYDPEEKVPI